LSLSKRKREKQKKAIACISQKKRVDENKDTKYFE